MKGVPPEIDDLMWRLAEEGGPAARAEFEARHARFGPELARRIHMVSDLRQAGRPPAHRPAFRPRPVAKAAAPRWAVGGAVALGALAIGAVAYVAASSGERPAPFVPPAPVRVQPVPTPPPTVVYQTPAKEPPREEKKQEEPKPTTTPKYLLPQEVRIEDTSLVAAIRLVAAGGGLDVTVAPGFEDRRVTLDYRGSGLNTVEILKAMGQEHGFSVLEEEDGHVLVVPAREERSGRRIGP